MHNTCRVLCVQNVSCCCSSLPFTLVPFPSVSWSATDCTNQLLPLEMPSNKEDKDKDNIRIISFDRCHQEQVIALFAHGLSNYKGVSPSVRASQGEFVKSKMAKGGDMFDIYESYMTGSGGAGSHFWVAVDEDDRVLGFVGMIMSTYGPSDTAIYESSPETRAGEVQDLSPQNVCELVRMSVSEEARGKGLGSRLCEVVEAHARRCGMKRIVLSTLESMYLAVGLYEKCGYRLLMKTDVDIEFYKHVAEQEKFEAEAVVIVHYGKDLL